MSPSSDGSKAKTVIFIADIFGYELVNTRLVADEYAAQGFHVVLPDFFEGAHVDYTLDTNTLLTRPFPPRQAIMFLTM